MMFLRQTSIEIRRTVRNPALWIGLGTLILLLGLYATIHQSQVKYGFIPAEGLEMDLSAGLSFYNWICGLVYAVTASVIMAYDYPDLRLWLTRGLPRLALLFARLTVILLISGLIIFLSSFAILAFTALSRLLILGNLDGTQMNMAAVLPVILRLFWSSLPYLSITVILAILSRSATIAAGAMIVYSTILEKLLLSISDRYPILTRYLPGQLALILQASGFSLDRAAARPVLNTGWISGSQAVFVTAVIFIIVCGLSLIIFSRQDLGG